MYIALAIFAYYCSYHILHNKLSQWKGIFFVLQLPRLSGKLILSQGLKM